MTDESILLAYINETPALLSSLYDCGLMPESHIRYKHGSSKRDWEQMLTIADHWRARERAQEEIISTPLGLPVMKATNPPEMA